MDDGEAADIALKRLLGNESGAEYELDLKGLDQAHGVESVRQMLEKSRFRKPRSIRIVLDPPGRDGEETLFQPVGRMLLDAKKSGVLDNLTPLPVNAGLGFFLITAGKRDAAPGE